jgi:hypothetical protein
VTLALTILLRPNDVTFVASAGTSEFARRWNPQPGDIVTFKHRGFLLNSQRPKFPALHRLRSDLTWNDVIQNAKEPKLPRFGTYNYSSLSLSLASFCLCVFPNIVNCSPLRRPAVQRRRRGYWNDINNWRNVFNEYAKAKGFDPLVITNWVAVTPTQIQAHHVTTPRPFFPYPRRES